MKTILAPIDFSDVTLEVLQNAVDLARALEAQLHVLNVVPLTPGMVGYMSEAGFVGPIPPTQQQDLENEKKLVGQFLERIETSGVQIQTTVLPGTPIHEILEAAGNVDADMIVIGSHGHGALYHLLLGSVSDAVIRRASCPVLIVHHQGKRLNPETETSKETASA